MSQVLSEMNVGRMQHGVVPEALLDSDFLLQLIEDLPQGTIILDSFGQVIFYNQQAGLFFSQLVYGAKWIDVVNAEIVEKYCDYKSIFLKSGQYLSIKTCPIRSGLGQVIMLTDITEEEHLQQKLNHKSRLSDLGKMAGSLAHQIRTPLSTAILYAKNVLACESGKFEISQEKKQKFLTKLSGTLEEIEQKIKEMLVFAKSQTLVKEPFWVSELAKNLNAIHEMNVRDNCGIAIQCHGADVEFDCNQILLVDAIDNCVVNAINASATHVLVDFNVQKDKLVVCIKDNGSGIEVDQIDKVMQPFFTTKQTGTGLGLSITKMITEAHGGKVYIESEKGKGTSVSLTFSLGGKYE